MDTCKGRFYSFRSATKISVPEVKPLFLNMGKGKKGKGRNIFFSLRLILNDFTPFPLSPFPFPPLSHDGCDVNPRTF
jgi:hypothetical protein